MKPATWPRERRLAERLLTVDPDTGLLAHRSIADLPGLFEAGDLLVVNDAATLPASFGASIRGEDAELRLAGFEGGTSFRAIVFGQGDARQPTETRGAAPRVSIGETIAFRGGLAAVVTDVDASHPRLIEVRFLGDDDRVWRRLVSAGSPIQYAYVDRPLSLYQVQTAFASRPWAVEMPSAGRPLDFDLLKGFAERGVDVATLTHGAGLSSTGDASLDARLPLRERYDLPLATVKAVNLARARGGRVVAVGTSVVRALESSFASGNGVLGAGENTTDLRLDAVTRPRLVDAILTGMHEPGTSHFELLEGFASAELLHRACDEASSLGYLLHEFGDSMLVVGERRRLLDAA